MTRTAARLAAVFLSAACAAGAAVAQTATPARTTPVPSPAQRSPERIEKIVAAMKEAKKAALDAPAPDFKLVDTAGKVYTLSDLVAAGNTVVLEWFNPECPYVQEHYNADGTGTSNAAEKALKDRKVVWLRINSSAPDTRAGSRDFNAGAAKEWKIASPILLDADGRVGRAYGAKVTPTLVVISADGIVRYEGLMDSEVSPSKTGEVIYPRAAVESLLAGEAVETTHTKAAGCGIHYARQKED